MRSNPKLTARRTDQTSASTVNSDARCPTLVPPSSTHLWTKVCVNGMRTQSTIDNPNPIIAHAHAAPSSFFRAMMTTHPSKLMIKIGNCPTNMETNAVSCESFIGFIGISCSGRRVACKTILPATPRRLWLVLLRQQIVSPRLRIVLPPLPVLPPRRCSLVHPDRATREHSLLSRERDLDGPKWDPIRPGESDIRDAIQFQAVLGTGPEGIGQRKGSTIGRVTERKS